MSARLPPVMTHAWKYTGSSAANPMGVEAIRIDRWPGLRAVVWILVHGLSGGAARHGRQFDVGRAAHAVDRRFPENGDAVHRDPARHRRDRAHANERGLLAAGQGLGLRLRSGAHHADDSFLSVRHDGPGVDRVDGVVHERHGGQRDRVQHGVHLRPLSKLHSHATRPTIIICASRAGPRWAAWRCRSRPRIWRSATTTSWTCCSWCSPS